MFKVGDKVKRLNSTTGTIGEVIDVFTMKNGRQGVTVGWVVMTEGFWAEQLELA